MKYTALVIATAIVSTHPAFAQDATYNGLYPGLTCSPYRGATVICGDDTCAEATSRPIDDICLSMATKTVYEDTNDVVATNHIDPKPFEKRGQFSIEDMAKPEINRPLYIRLKYSARTVLLRFISGGQIFYGISTPLPSFRNGVVAGNITFNRIIAVGSCRVVQSNECEEHSH